MALWSCSLTHQKPLLISQQKQRFALFTTEIVFMPQKRLLIYYLAIVLFICFIGIDRANAQCSYSITTYPYFENFEASDGGWFTGGTASDWTWGQPQKKVINQAFSGSKCWVTGGLTGSLYNNNELSYLQSPCFNLSSLINPYLTFKIFWETENIYDGGSMQYSIDSGKTFTILGSYADGQTCPYDNWFNTPTVTSLSYVGWSGNVQTTSACNGGTGGGLGKWASVKHDLQFLARQTHVIFRFTFAAGSQCNNYDGFAIDDISIGEQPINNATFTYTCSVNRYVQFNANDVVCPSTYLWDFGEPISGASNVATAQSPSHNYAVPGSYNITLTINNPSLGLVSSTQTVNVIDVSTSIIQNLVCYGDKNGIANVTVAGPTNTYYYLWNSIPTQTTPTASNLPAGTYTVTISASNTCLSQATVTLTQPTALLITTNIINPICTTKGSIALTTMGGTPNYNFTWQPNITNTNTATNLAAGKYHIVINDGNNCIDSVTVTIVNLPNTLVVNLGKDTAFCPGETLVLNPGTYATYTWQDQSHNAIYNASITGNYYVTVGDKNGCTASDSVFVTVNCDDVFFPTAFTPNGDGRNDEFGPIGKLQTLQDYSFQVFDRYGQVVFATTNPFKKWNGKANGILQTGIYVWYANYSILTRKNVFQKGTVMIVR